MHKKFHLNCMIEKRNGYLYNSSKPVLINVFLNCSTIDVHISVFYPRGDFLYAGGIGEIYSSGFNGYFGDVARAINNFDANLIVDVKKEILFIPNDLERFLYDFQYSKFLECRNETLKRVESDSEAKMISSLKYLTNTLEKLGKQYWLTSGNCFLDCFLNIEIFQTIFRI